MEEPAGRYINPYTDYGFKYLFGTEPNKEFTLALVNELLRGREVIRSLTLIPSEQLGDTKERLRVGAIAGMDRRAVFDVYAENERGEKIIIEMQKADQQYFQGLLGLLLVVPHPLAGREGPLALRLESRLHHRHPRLRVR